MVTVKTPVLHSAFTAFVVLSLGLSVPVYATTDDFGVAVQEKATQKPGRRFVTKKRLTVEIAARTSADTAESLARQSADSAETAARQALDNTLLAEVSASKHVIGDVYGGGYVFFVYDGGRHGLVVTGTDSSAATPSGQIITDFKWGGFTAGADPQPFISNAIADGLGAGKSNTAYSIAAQIANNDATVSTPAMLCHFHRATPSIDGITYSEWYLPSKYELNLLYQSRNSIPGGFAAAPYWSSTEFWDSTQPLGVLPSAWSQSFADGSQAVSPKTSAFRVRAIRSF